MKTNIHFWTYVSKILLEWDMFQTNVVQKIKHTFYDQQLFPESRAVYKKMWENIVEPDRPHMTI